MPTPAPPIEWARLNVPSPLTAVQMFVTDGTNLLLIHRSDKVRSVKNVWSFPSGLHDIGESIFDTAARELMEEFNLAAKRMVMIGDIYENIVVTETPSWHWVLFPVAVYVESFASFVNNEPDKHDLVEMFPLDRISELCREYVFHPSFLSYFVANTSSFMRALRKVSESHYRHHDGFCRMVEVRA